MTPEGEPRRTPPAAAPTPRAPSHRDPPAAPCRPESVAVHAGQLLQPVPGGIGHYVRELVPALVGAGLRVVPFAAGDLTGRLDSNAPAVDLGRPGPPWRYELWHRLSRPRVRLPVDVVHAPSLAVPPVTGSALVVTVNDVAFLRHPDVFTRRGRAFHRRGLDLARRHAHSIVTPSAFVRSELAREGFDPGSIVVAPHGASVPPPADPSAHHALLARAGVEEPFVLAVGTIEPRKNLGVLAAAVGRLRTRFRGLSLVLAGPPGWLEVPGIDGPEVRRLGAVDDATLEALYERAAACGVPSIYEGFGLPALEAMARGCPLVVSDSASLPEVVGDTALLAPPGDVDAWGEHLGSILDDPVSAGERTARARERAARFSWERSAELHLLAFGRAMQARAGGHL